MISATEVAAVSKSNFLSHFEREELNRVCFRDPRPGKRRPTTLAGFAFNSRRPMHSVGTVARPISGLESRYYDQKQQTEEVRK